MFSIAAAEKSIGLSRHTRSPVTVLCERDLLLRVFSNLIGNAIKFTPTGGAISVSAETLSGQVHFSVKDSGPGIPADHLAHIFDRYWQQKDSDRRGSGLGLYIAKGIVEAHGGRIWAESKLGEGSTMHFALPAHDTRTTPPFCGREDGVSITPSD
jgi:signal transduction histidine kinase